MFVKCLTVFLCAVISTVSSNNYSLPTEYCINSRKPMPDYYWRKYEGVIPFDAIPGGHTANGSITFIGQVLIIKPDKSALLPGIIEIGKHEVAAPFYGVYTSKKYAAILCSSYPQSLKWKATDVNKVNLIHDYFVVGGYETNQPAYIGRVSHANHLIVGKVFTEGAKGLRIPTPDNKEKYFDHFEVLVFDENE